MMQFINHRTKNKCQQIKYVLILIVITFTLFPSSAKVYAVQEQCQQTHTAGSESELNAAVTAFNGESGDCNHTVTLSANITLTADLTEIKNSTNGAALTIMGNNQTLDGADDYFPIQIAPNTIVNIDSLSVTRSSRHGIVNEGIMTLSNSAISYSDDRAFWTDGTAIIENSTFINNGESFAIRGDTTIRNSTIENNDSVGVDVFSAHTMIIDSTIRNNNGDGVSIRVGGHATILNSTLNGNSEHGIDNEGVANIGNSTISNHSDSGIYQRSGEMMVTNSTIAATNIGVEMVNGTLNMANSIIANSMNTDCVYNGGSLDIVYSLVENPAAGCSDFIANGTANISGQDPLLGALADNGGATLTHALLENSPALDSGDNTLCEAESINNLDQRGVARPQRLVCDMGAFELEQELGVSNCEFAKSNAVDFSVSVATLAELNGWLGCYNDATRGTHTINLGQDLTLSETTTPIHNTRLAELVINGNGYTIDGANSYRHFSITAGLVTIENITLQNGKAHDGACFGGFCGGAVYVDELATVTINNATLRNNEADMGGAIAINAKLTVNNSTLVNNNAAWGGAFFQWDGITTFNNSTMSGNSADRGGAIYHNKREITLNHVTIAENTATDKGAAYFSKYGWKFFLNNSILTSDGSKDTCHHKGTKFKVTNTLANDANCKNTITSESINLGPLQDNGGSTLTHALLANSSAIDAGDNAICESNAIRNLDQRGVTRTEGTACDIGAYEFETSELGGTAVSLTNSASTANMMLIGILSGLLLVGIAGVVIRQRREG